MTVDTKIGPVQEADAEPQTPSYGGRVFVVGSLIGASAASVGLVASIGSLNLSSAMLLAGVAFALLALAKGRLGKMRIRFFDWIAILYAVSSVTIETIDSLRLNHDPNYAYSAAGFYYLAAYFAARLAVTNISELRYFVRGLTWPVFPVAILAALQLAGIPSVTDFLTTQVNSPAALARSLTGAATRATSLLGHWTALGAYLCCIIAAACMILVLDRRAGRRISTYILLVLVASVIGLVCTLTFAVVFAGLAILLIAAYQAGVGKRFTVFLGVTAVGLWLLFGALIQGRIDSQATTTATIPEQYAWLPQTIGFRIVLWINEGIPSFLEQPVFGWGQSVYKSVDGWPISPTTLSWPAPESEWIKALVVSGLVGFIALMILLGGMHRHLRLASFGPLGYAVFPIVVLFWAFVVSSFIAPYFTNQGAPAVLWPLLGAIAWSAQSKQRQIDTSPQASVTSQAVFTSTGGLR